MAQILGLDLGTNSIGWAIRDKDIKNEGQILDSGVLIFPQGVGEVKGVEFSLASERTKNRATRKIYRRRKKRKADLLKVLIENNMCPLTLDELSSWTIYKKGQQLIYPTQNNEFQEWLKIYPYGVRKKASEKKVSKLEIGRALYHICQRRGFKSGRKDADAGKDLIVYKEEKEKRGNLTLGSYYYEQLKNGEKVRKTKYKKDDNEVNSSRISYIEEFNVIIEKQEIEKELSDKLFEAIFFQRPLKSQKGSIGKCTLEKTKPRCPISHPLYEEFRLHQFLNSIKIKNKFGDNNEFEFLTRFSDYYTTVKKLFFRKSKPNFKFSDISKAINKEAKKRGDFYFCNYKDVYPIVGCPTISNFISVFDSDDWSNCKEIIINKYKLPKNKSTVHLIDELWHTLFFSDDFVNDITSGKIKEFIRKRFDITEEQIEKYERIKLKQGYASLSKKALKKITPFLKEHIIYSHAVFFANIDEIVGTKTWKKDLQFIQDTIIDIIDRYREENLKIDIVNGLVGDFIKEYDNSNYDYILDNTDKQNVTKKIILFFGKRKWNNLDNKEKEAFQLEIENLFQAQLQKRRIGGYFLSKPRLDEKIKQFLTVEFKISKEQTNKLYHPSAIDIYQDSASGLLESPFTTSVRNPMAMRTLYQLKQLINTLLKEDKIDSSTHIIIELARELNDKNRRLAIERYQREREKENLKFKNLLEEFTVNNNNVVSSVDIIKYRLRDEQNRKCLYTGKEIVIETLFGSNPKFDIEHTFPRSKSFDNSLENKTLADKSFNQIKENRIPQELDKKYIDTVLNNIEHWKEEIEDLKEKIELQKYFSRIASTKQQKDRAIQQKHYLLLHLKYWNNKYRKFTDTEIHYKFKNSQLVDTGIITKYAKLYLQTLFKNVFPAKGTMVATVRESWGLPKKNRDLHYHHAIDAIVLSCMTKNIRDSLAKAYKEAEELGKREKFKIKKPWNDFTQNILEIQKDILVVHHHNDNLLKQTKRKLRKQNKIEYTKDGKIKYEQGQGIRGQLHKETFYGAIERTNEKDEKVIWYVTRKNMDSSFTENDVSNIVDEGIKERILKYGLKNIRTEEGFVLLPKEKGKKKMLIKKIRIKTSFKHLSVIKKQSHVSQKNRKPYKENYYASLENIFAMAVYQKTNEKGKKLQGFKTIAAFDVAKYNQGKQNIEIPVEQNILKNKGEKSEVLIPLNYVLKVNQMILFYEKSKNELKQLSKQELSNRLYKITQFEGDGRIQLRHHIQGGADKNLKKESLLNFEKPAQKLRMSLSNFKAAIENKDFTISKSATIRFNEA
ncbi:MAG: hypothetical protein L3J14_03220 [Flavobacteriaceae bacterium]|nr:hypothetical protein [Flavobacteriaceae bacterium]